MKNSYSAIIKQLTELAKAPRLQGNHYFVGTRTLKELLIVLKELGNTYHRAVSETGRKLNYYHIKRNGEPLFNLYINTFDKQLDGEIIVAPKTSFILGATRPTIRRDSNELFISHRLFRYDYGIK